MKTQGNMRELLTKIGIGQFNATMIIQYMFIAPATTDPKSPSVVLLVRHVQRALNRLGAGLRETGYLDVATANVMEQVVGPGWESRSWGDNISALVNAIGGRKVLHTAELEDLPESPDGRRNLGIWDPPFLPAVPGGVVTYALAALVGLHYLKQRKR